MDDKSKQHKKIAIDEFLHSILYPKEGSSQPDIKGPMPSKRGSKSKGQTKDKLQMRDNVRYLLFGLIIFLLSLIIFLLCIVTSLAVLKDIERQKRVQAEYNIKEMAETKESLQAQLDEYMAKVQFQEEDLVNLRNVLAKSRGLIKELLASFKRERLARLQFQQQFNDTKDILISAMGGKSYPQEIRKPSGAQQNKIETISSNVNSRVIVNGAVLVVDKESGIALVNLGKKDKLDTDMVLAVYRDNMLIARLSVTRVEERMSAARIVPSWRDITIIKEGDSVRLLQ